MKTNKTIEIILTVTVLYCMATFNTATYDLGKSISNVPANSLAYNITSNLLESQGSLMDSASFKLGFYMGKFYSIFK